jgi:hypothetical protein
VGGMRSTKSVVLPASEAVLWRNKTVIVGRASERERGPRSGLGNAHGHLEARWEDGRGSRRMTTGAESEGLPAAVRGKKDDHGDGALVGFSWGRSRVEGWRGLAAVAA